MDYLDPKKALKHHLTLMIGYVLVAVAIAMATIVLLYQAYGFGIGKNGKVIQSGLAFFSSQPNPASIYLNGKLNKAQTDTRLSLPADIYQVRLTRLGYTDWQRDIEVEGGDVQHFDYPFLIPQKLTSKKLATFAAAPGFVTQSPDKRWLLVQDPGSSTNFQAYDLKSPDKSPQELALPSGIASQATSSSSWQLGEWADDNKHVVLQHTYDGKTEFILVDRTAPDQALNLNSTLSVNPVKLTLIDKKYDHYYLYGAGVLQTATLSDKTPQPVLDHVLNYQSYGSDTILYATDSGVPAGKVQIRLRSGDRTDTIRSFNTGSVYLLDLTKYSGALYVAAGSTTDNRAYIYKDPVGQLNDQPKQAVVPSQVLHVTQPNYLSFSNSAQFIMVENNAQFGVYDIENTKGYNYMSKLPLDAPQAHASWMDGNRLTYVSGGKLVIFDYDNANPRTLVAASAAYLPVWAPNYKFVYTLAPAAAAPQESLNQTSLLTPADQ